jgi:hypothetical protein
VLLPILIGVYDNIIRKYLAGHEQLQCEFVKARLGDVHASSLDFLIKELHFNLNGGGKVYLAKKNYMD